MRFWPDGKSIVRSDIEGDRANLFRVDLATNKIEKLTNFSEMQTFPFDISPDGKRIVLARGLLTRDAVLVSLR